MQTLIRLGSIALMLAALTVLAAEGTAVSLGEHGHVISLNGKEAYVIHGANKVPLHPGMQFQAGDILVTGFRTSAKLLMGDGEVAMLMNPNSILYVHKTLHRDYEVSVKFGGLLSTVRQPGTQATHYVIHTSTATMGVRGTTLFVKETPHKPTFFCPCHGKIAVTSANSAEVDFDSQHHDNPKLISAGKGALASRMRPIPAKMDVQHNDAEIADLQRLLKN